MAPGPELIKGRILFLLRLYDLLLFHFFLLLTYLQTLIPVWRREVQGRGTKATAQVGKSVCNQTNQTGSTIRAGPRRGGARGRRGSGDGGRDGAAAGAPAQQSLGPGVRN